MDLNSQKSRFLEITISNPVWTHLKDRLAFGRSQIGFFEDPNFLSHTVMNVAPDDIFEPQTHQEAISCPESAKWISAMEEVMESLRLNETWQLQPLLEGRRRIRNNLADPCVYRRNITARDADFFIGLKIDRDRTRRVIHLSQEQYTNRILRRFEMLECNPKMQPAEFFGDNQGALKLVSNPEFHRHTKHTDVRYHYVREQQTDGSIVVSHVGTKEQLAERRRLLVQLFQDLRRKIYQFTQFWFEWGC
jgi:hypothetical protein